MFELTDEQRIEAIYNAVPQRPRRHEVGGSYYYVCHWLKCNNTVTRWQNYCDQCGQRIDWRDEE